MRSSQLSLRILTAAILFAAIAPRLMGRGMFVDGVTYAAVARNLAEGRGSFWQPFYTATVYPSFHEQPPLGMWLESLWFRALGDHLYVERLYAAFTAALTALLIAAIWRRRYPSTPARELDWLPVLLWIACPVVSWVIVGNLLEATLAIFSTAAVALVFAAARPRSDARAAACGAASGLLVMAGFLTKGPLGLFPLAAPLIMLWLVRRDRTAWWVLAAQWAMAAACAIALVAASASRESLATYFNQAVFAAVAGNRETSPGTFTILREWLSDVLLPLVAAAVLIVAAAHRSVAPAPDDRRWAVVWLLVGLCGTLPIVISRKQTGHYLAPAAVFFALSAAGFLSATAQAAADRLTFLARPRTAVLAAMVAIAFSGVAAGRHWFSRDAATMDALDAVKPFVPEGATLGICPEASTEWGLHAWFERRYHVSLDFDPAHRHGLMLSVAPHPACLPPACAPVSNPSLQLVVLRCS